MPIKTDHKETFKEEGIYYLVKYSRHLHIPVYETQTQFLFINLKLIFELEIEDTMALNYDLLGFNLQRLIESRKKVR